MAAVIRHGGACNVEWPRLPPMMATCTPYFPSRCYCGGGGGGGGGGMSRAVPCVCGLQLRHRPRQIEEAETWFQKRGGIYYSSRF